MAATAIPEIRPPPPIGDDRVEIRLVGEELERDRALTGDYRRIVIGMNENQPFIAGERVGRLAGGSEAVALEHDLGAVRLGAIDLDERRALGHHDRRRDAEPPGVVGDPLGMVAGRHRNHTHTARTRVQGQQLGERAAFLERTGAMQRLELQINLGADKFRDCRRRYRGRVRNSTLDRRGGLPDRCNCQRQLVHHLAPAWE